MSAASSDELRHLQDLSPDSPTGFHGVYPHRRMYCAKALKMDVGSHKATPRQAAADLAAWWREWFGPRWPKFYEARKAHPTRIITCPGGFRVLIFLMGRPFFLGCRKRRGRRVWVPVEGSGDVLRTRAEAQTALRLFSWWRYGLFQKLAGLEVRRDSMAAPKAGVVRKVDVKALAARYPGWNQVPRSE